MSLWARWLWNDVRSHLREDDAGMLTCRMLRTSLDSLPPSRIREVANAALGRDDIVKFWFGEGDQPTPAFIREAAKSAPRALPHAGHLARRGRRL